MDILVKLQSTGDINLIVPLTIDGGTPDTGATLTVKAINPDGSENTSFTAPTISEAIAGSGVYKLIFPAAAGHRPGAGGLAQFPRRALSSTSDAPQAR